MSAPLADRAIATYVQHRLQAEYDAEPRGYMADLSRKVGMSTAHLANAKNKGSVGAELAQRLAKVWGMSWDELRDAAGVPTATATTVPDERYPNREVAIELASGKVGPEIVRAVRKVRLDGADLSVTGWVEKMRELQTIAGGFGEPVSRDVDDAVRPAKRKR